MIFFQTQLQNKKLHNRENKIELNSLEALLMRLSNYWGLKAKNQYHKKI